MAPKLVAAGADALHVSIGLGSTSFDKIIEPMSMPEGWRLPYSRRIREATGVPVITVGQIRWPKTAERAIAQGDADLIALGRPLLADPEWANKARSGREADICPCTSCNYCVAVGMRDGGIACADNPRTGRELESLPAKPVARGARAVVIGAGPGGIQAALLLDQVGYRAELFEARPVLGGGLIASAAPPFKDKLDWYRNYLQHRLAGSRVLVRLQSVAALDDITRPPPAVVVLAIGGRARKLDIPGIGLPLVHDAYELLMGDLKGLPAASERSVIVYGGGETGCETAEFLAERDYPVTLLTRSPAAQLARSAEMIYRGVLLQRLRKNPRIRIRDNSRLTQIGTESVVVTDSDGKTDEIATSCVLIAQGRESDPTLAKQLRVAGIRCITIGDARQGGRIGDAVRDAYSAILSLNDSSNAAGTAIGRAKLRSQT
jgi:NADPH-dependent 2,4-dienoyl-CoA reductase/sulfur reductase-like enzyme